MTPELRQLLERYHDGEVSPEETARVESLIEQDVEALEYLALLDDQGDLFRAQVHREVDAVSFEGFWDGVSDGIAKAEAADRAAAEAEARANAPGFGERVGAWLKTIFVEHRSAWITATATAAAVFVVMNYMVPEQTVAPTPGPAPGPSVAAQDAPKVIERHIIYVDSVDKADPESMVLVNSIKEEDTAVIWLLPNQQGQGAALQARDDEQQEEDDEGIEIVDEPL